MRPTCLLFFVEFEPWPQASKFVSWKVSFRREAISGSTHPRLNSDWSAQIDLATGIEDWDHSGFIFDKHLRAKQTTSTLKASLRRRGVDALPATG